MEQDDRRAGHGRTGRGGRTTHRSVTVGIAWCPYGTKVVARHTKPDGTTEVILDEENRKDGPIDAPVELGAGIGRDFAPLRGVHRFECEIRLPDGTTLKRRLAVVARGTAGPR